MSGLFDLTGRTAVITAGYSPIGLAMAEGLAEFGASVVIAGRDTIKGDEAVSRLAEMYGGGHRSIYLDLEQQESIPEAFTAIQKWFGSVDILIHNAAFSQAGALTDLEYAGFMRGLEGTAGGAFAVIKEALKVMISQKRGSIINVASMYGVVSPNPEIYGGTDFGSPAGYGSGKAAIIQLTRYIACYYGPMGIRANSISPGPFPREEVQKNTGFVKNLANKTALKRIGHPDELKGVAVLLASDAGSYITGQNYCVDGGWTAW